MQLLIQKTILLTIPGLGIGSLPDAYVFQDRDCNSLGHLAEDISLKDLNFFTKAGIGNLTYMNQVERVEEPIAFYGKMQCVSDSKDSFIGSWEISGFKYYNPEQRIAGEVLNEKSVEEIQSIIKLKTVGNASYTDEEIIQKIVPFHLDSQEIILFSNEQRNLYLASFLEFFSLEKLQEIAELLKPFCRKNLIQRIIIRPIIEKREKYFFDGFVPIIVRELSQQTIFNIARRQNLPVTAIGSFSEYFLESSFDEVYFENSDEDRMNQLMKLVSESKVNKNGQAILACGLKELEEKYAIKKDREGLLKYLQWLDNEIIHLTRKMDVEDILIVASNSGFDLRRKGNVNTREYTPFLVYSKMLKPYNRGFLGVRKTMADIAETISEMYELNSHFGAESFWKDIIEQI